MYVYIYISGRVWGDFGASEDRQEAQQRRQAEGQHLRCQGLEAFRLQGARFLVQKYLLTSTKVLAY
jgi:hypothetical protein